MPVSATIVMRSSTKPGRTSTTGPQTALKDTLKSCSMPRATPPAEPAIRQTGYVPELDALRGIAILMVLVAHFNNEALVLEGSVVVGAITTKLALLGLHGVDLFFVLSGYLITRILLNTKGDPRYFTNFYMRRFVRIFPLYYGALFCVFIVAPAFAPFDTAADALRSKQWGLWLYLGNLPVSPPWGWDSSEAFKLGHFWSLAVEEHFYLIWPACVGSLGTKRLKQLCVSLIVLGAFARFNYSLFGENVLPLLRWSTVSRIDGLAIGSLIAVLIVSEGRHAATVRIAKVLLLPSALIFFVTGFVPRAWHIVPLDTFQVTVAVILFGAVLIRAQASSGRFAQAVFHSRTLIMFGKYSYGLYVIHGILRPWLRSVIRTDWLLQILPSPWLANLIYILAATAICLLLAMISWHLYESQFLRLKKYFE